MPIGILVIAIIHNKTNCAKTIIPIDWVNTSSEFNLLYLINKYPKIIIVAIPKGIIYGLIISLPLVFATVSISISSAFNSVPYFSSNVSKKRWIWGGL